MGGDGGDARTRSVVLWLPVLRLLPACGSDGLMHHGVLCVQVGMTALMSASVEGHAEVVGQLLDRGAEVNAKDEVCEEAYGACTGTREGAYQGETKRTAGVIGDDARTHVSIDCASRGCCLLCSGCLCCGCCLHAGLTGLLCALCAAWLYGLDCRQRGGPHRGGGEAAGQGRRRECRIQGMWRGLWCMHWDHKVGFQRETQRTEGMVGAWQ